MKTSPKLLVLFITMLFGLLILMSSDIKAQNSKSIKLEIKHKPGESRTVNITKLITRNVISKNKKSDNKINAYEMCFSEICVESNSQGTVDRLFLEIVKSRKKVSGNSEVIKNDEEGQTSVLTGEKLLKYKKMQPDFGLILPSSKIELNEIWKPSEEQIKQLFDKKIQEGNSVAYKLTKLERNDQNQLIATVERELVLNFIVPSDEKNVDSTGIEKSRTTYVIDIENKRFLSISEAQVLIMEVTNSEEQKIIMQVATDTTYDYKDVELYKTQISPEVGIEQTERSFVNFSLKMLITSKADQVQLVSSKDSETDKIYKRKTLKAENGEVSQYSMNCEYDKTIESETSIKGKKTISVTESSLDNKDLIIKKSEDGKKIITDESGNDLTDKIQLPENSQSGIKMNLPRFPIPVGYTIDVKDAEALSMFSGVFTEIDINSVSALLTFTRVMKQDQDISIAEFRLDVAVTGKTKDFGRLYFAISIFNFIDLKKNRIKRIFTNPLKNDEAVLRLRFENEKILVDGIGMMQIDSVFTYSDETNDNPMKGTWVLVDRDSKEQNTSYKLRFSNSGLIMYSHPYINGKDTLNDRGVWRIQNDMLTVKFGYKKDIFQFKIVDNELIMTKLVQSTNATSIFPFRVNQSDRYKKSSD